MNSPKVQSSYVYKQIEAYLFQGTTMRNISVCLDLKYKHIKLPLAFNQKLSLLL
jgi:hypothetical protein